MIKLMELDNVPYAVLSKINIKTKWGLIYEWASRWYKLLKFSRKFNPNIFAHNYLALVLEEVQPSFHMEEKRHCIT